MTVRRVLSVIETLGRGGAEQLLVTQHQHLDRYRFEGRVATLFEPTPLSAALEAEGVAVTRLSLPGPSHLPLGIVRLRALIRAWRPHVVHTHLYYANLAGRIASAGLAPVFTTLHNPDYSFEDTGTIGFKLKKWLDRQTGNRLNQRVFAVSEHVRRDFERHLGFRNVEVLHNSTDIEAIRERMAAVDRVGARARLGIGSSEVVVLHVGRLHSQKGQDILLRALAGLGDSAPPWRVLFVGTGPDRDLRALSTALRIDDRVGWIGSVDDVTPFYAAADLFAFPSRYEAFGLALLEAMACGLPSIVSDAEGIGEVVTTETSLVAPAGDPLTLSACLERLLADAGLRASMGAAAAARAREFDVRARLPRLEEAYLDA